MNGKKLEINPQVLHLKIEQGSRVSYVICIYMGEISYVDGKMHTQKLSCTLHTYMLLGNCYKTSGFFIFRAELKVVCHFWSFFLPFLTDFLWSVLSFSGVLNSKTVFFIKTLLGCALLFSS